MTEVLPLAPLSPLLVEPIVRAALLEDLGGVGDVTTDAVIPQDARFSGAIVARKPGIVAGVDAAVMAFRLIDPSIELQILRRDGSEIEPGDVLIGIDGPARGVLTAERVALNMLGRLCGVATVTAALVQAVRPHKARIAATRKTTPGLRVLEKHAVRAAGGIGHRFGLNDGVLIKDNHIAVAGGVAAAIERAKAAVGHMLKIEVEVDRLDQLEEALSAGCDAVLLDNMSLETLRAAVALVGGTVLTEASGNISLASVASVAATGVDVISSGGITHSAPCLDLGLDVD